MPDIVIRAETLGKKYLIGHQREDRYQTLRDVVAGAAQQWSRRVVHPLRARSEPRPPAREEFWALKDVSFEVRRGERVGIVGRNGAGKSTLLKILSRITEPSSGRVSIRGRVASLLEVGTGFHPELTGRENIYLNGAILGMSRREVVRKFDEIVAFAEVEKFLDTPVKRYSSGMYVRLAFAVAAHLETDILMVDEVLAVGDASFQKKCLGKMGEVANEGRTVLFISHNMRAIQSMCGRSILLVNGRLVRTGTTDEVVNEYLGGLIDETSTPLTQRTDRTGDGRFRFVDLVFDSRSKDVIKCGEKIEIQMGFEAEGSPSNVNVSIAFSDITGTRALHLDNYVAGSPFKRLPETGRIVCTLDKFPLLPGRYTLNLYCTVDGKLADWIKEAAIIMVADGDFFGSGCFPLSGYGYTVVDQRWGLGKDA